MKSYDMKYFKLFNTNNFHTYIRLIEETLREITLEPD